MADQPITGALGDFKDTVAETAEKAREGVAEGVSSARDRIKGLTNDVQKSYNRVSKDVRKGAERATAELKRSAEAARERAQETAETVREGYVKVRSQAGELSEQVSSYVRENPGKSVLMAAGVGFLLGLLFRGNRGDDED
jgi:ElaB/YqjD/DUF883 family membrane-anchored ribosome-binding protein